MRERVDHLLLHASSLITMGAGAIPRRGADAQEVGRIEDGGIAIKGERIVAAGPSEEIAARFDGPPEATLDLGGFTVLPGFVDPHTHVLFAGSRENEFEMRLAGKSYMEIAASGGGILGSVRAFRDAGDAEILSQTRARLDRMLIHGTTTIEAKSGYGLSTEQELRALVLLDRLAVEHPIGIVSTFMGAHAVPPEYGDDRDGYVRLVCEEMIPLVAARTGVRFCDVFCERGVFTPEEARAILGAGRQHGLLPRLHADEFAPSGASELAAELHALSADHLMEADEDGLRALERSGTIAILLPATSFSMGNRRYAPARRIAEMGIPIALATDCNPGSSMTASLPLVLTLALLEMKMTLGEVLNAVTVNAAAALGLSAEVGRITRGMRADLQVLPTRTPAGIAYQLGGLLPARVMKSGRWVSPLPLTSNLS